MLKQTPLNAAHRRMGAKMVDFGGWDMPLSYGSQLDEHHQVRRDAGMFDVSHMLVADVQGEGVRGFLRGLVANNVDKLTVPGKGLYSCMLNPEGGVIDDLIIYFMAENRFRIVVNAGTADKDIAWMREQVAERALTITPRRDLAMIAVQGPQARAKVWAAIPGSEAATSTMKPFNAIEFQHYFIARTGYTGEDGFEVILPAGEAEALWQRLAALGVKPAGLGARDTLRLEAGMNLYGQDMDDSTSPLESGLAWTVDLRSEREFVGKAALQSRDIDRQLAGLVLLDKGVLRAHQSVRTRYGDGVVTSGTFSPTLQQSIALARIPLGIAPGTDVTVQVRDRELTARVVNYPFVRNGKAVLSPRPGPITEIKE
ncbi:MAG TPA: glycine cleavage system aminomethyltransferase GcvT [Burkholderiales bacterium]|nr:glycine cleavage system aminomethyltransferase GcvT [Burkholderiales bacterium]